MSLWKNTDHAANSVKGAVRAFNKASGKAAIAANNTALYGNVTPGAFVANMAVGQFGVSTAEMANTDGEAGRIAHPGWVIRRAGTGPVTAFAVSTPGAGYGNGETIRVSNGTVNATGVITTNAAGNIASVAVSEDGAGFLGAGLVTIEFLSEKHLRNVNVSDGGSGYDNTDVVTVANGTTNATASIVTDGSGNIQSVAVVTPGLWANNKANNHAAFSVANSSGGATGGTGAVLVANLSAGSDGVVTVTVGGRAGRIHYETLAAIGSISGDGSDDTILPE